MVARNESVIRVVELWCMLLVSLVVSSTGSAAQSRFVKPHSVVLEAYVDYYDIDVSARATASRNDHGVSTLSALYISYDDTLINVPSQIVDQIKNPILSSLKLTYCPKSRIVLKDRDGGIEKVVPADKSKPCLGLHLSFRSQDGDTEDEHEPYLEVNFRGAEVVGYSTWRHDGFDWVRERGTLYKTQ